MKDKKLSVTIGIASYNAADNIIPILSALTKQEQKDFTLKKIIVHSDASSDNTVKIIKELKNKRITIVDNKNRKGFAGSIKTIIGLNKEDILILLNDDILIEDFSFINKLIQAFIEDEKAGLVCGHPQPLSPTTFVEAAILSSFRAYDKMRFHINHGNSNYSCDGKILGFSREFIKQLNFPNNLKDMGNTDAYMYFLCITKGFHFRFVKDAIVYYRNPTVLSDFIKWYSRNNSNKDILIKNFGEIVERDYQKPIFIYWKYMFFEFIKNPLGCLFIFLTGIYISKKSKIYSRNFNPRWDTILTTKKL